MPDSVFFCDEYMLAVSIWFWEDMKAITVKSWYLEVVGTIFYKSKLPEVQINLHFG